MDRAEIVSQVTEALTCESIDEAGGLLRKSYPFKPIPTVKRRFAPQGFTSIFLRDGFICRYSGKRLIFPPALRLLSCVFPSLFPYHPNWKTNVTHPAYMQLSATIDHLHPVSRGGVDDRSNWVTASMARNSAKVHWTLEEIGWELHPAGNWRTWDGLLRWSVEYAATHPEVVPDRGVRAWLRAGQRALNEAEQLQP